MVLMTLVSCQSLRSGWPETEQRRTKVGGKRADEKKGLMAMTAITYIKGVKALPRGAGIEIAYVFAKAPV